MNLNFFTAKFPYGNSEPIIDREFPFLLAEFCKINIFPHVFDNKVEKENLSRACTMSVCLLPKYKNSKLNFWYNILIINFFIQEFFNTRKKLFYIKHTMLWLSYLKEAALKAKTIEDGNLLLPNAINYSYWMNDWALSLVFLKKRKVINNFIFRCGGFDIWDERNDGNYLPFRELIYKYANAVFPNSKLAEQYIKGKTKFKDKVIGTYLGTEDFGLAEYKKSEDDPLKIVSCGNLYAMKRTKLIIEILEHVNRPVHWIHFGDGPEMSDIERLVTEKLQKHTVELKGNIPNTKLIEFYQKKHVDLFLTTSSTEGLPVSIQEAISFGIPIIATNVGAMNEIVNNRTGYLIDKYFEINDVVSIIENWSKNNDDQIEFRKGVRKFWLENFQAIKVYPLFILRIKAAVN